MQLAIAEVEAKEFSLREAACCYRIPKTSLANRLNSSLPAIEAHDAEKKLSYAQEEILVN